MKDLQEDCVALALECRQAGLLQAERFSKLAQLLLSFEQLRLSRLEDIQEPVLQFVETAAVPLVLGHDGPAKLNEAHQQQLRRQDISALEPSCERNLPLETLPSSLARVPARLAARGSLAHA